MSETAATPAAMGAGKGAGQAGLADAARYRTDTDGLGGTSALGQTGSQPQHASPVDDSQQKAPEMTSDADPHEGPAAQAELLGRFPLLAQLKGKEVVEQVPIFQSVLDDLQKRLNESRQ
ncbi:hypothetical protein CRD60_00330 [Bifidobacterium aemilianum]|uniref:Uncharacterized protein n=1 Tax=Bifidobacterium aemilianum TaxID=2493120 RepID=A0A366KAT8_9BIFI|nr:hypothetical protein [Bifidobacterium aemilianum]RBP98362.1 hypothetical protein CRD60_00330 [Bifidobacterium aemilianum]